MTVEVIQPFAVRSTEGEGIILSIGEPLGAPAVGIYSQNTNRITAFATHHANNDRMATAANGGPTQARCVVAENFGLFRTLRPDTKNSVGEYQQQLSIAQPKNVSSRAELPREARESYGGGATFSCQLIHFPETL